MNQNLIIYLEVISTNSTAQNIYNANFQSTEKTTTSTNQQKNYRLQKNMKTKYQSYRPRTFKKLLTALCRHKDAPVQSHFSPIKSCYLIKFLIIAMKTQQRTCKSALAMMKKLHFQRLKLF